MRGARSRVNAASGKGLVTILTGLQRAEVSWPNVNPDQAQGRVAQCSRHSPDLAIAAFGNGQAQPRVTDGFALPNRGIALPYAGRCDGLSFCRSGHAIFKFNA